MIWTFDLETEQWEHFVLGAAVSEEGDIADFRCERDLADWYSGLDPTDEVWAHNGGRFDALLLVRALMDMGATRIHASMAGSSVSTLWAPGCARVRDSARLAPMKLSDLAVGFGGGATKGDLSALCHCGAECGGYCAVTRDMSSRVRHRVREYCVRDCEALLAAIIGLRDFAERHGIVWRTERGAPLATVGGWATSTAERYCDFGEVPDWGTYHLARAAYYGGRVEVHRWRCESGHRYDLRSAYAHAMTRPLPAGRVRHIRGVAASRAYVRGDPGGYDADVVVPSGLPLLPMRVGPRLVWATGHVTGTWHRDEMRAAERHGARIDRVRAATVAEREEPWLRPYIRRVWELRAKELSDAAEGVDGAVVRQRWLKLLGNALSGKLAQRPGMESLRIVASDADVPQRATYLGEVDGGGAWSVVQRVIPRCARPLAAGVVTARARVAVMDRLALAGSDAIYCDTDSVYSARALPASPGHELGGWTDEGTLTDWWGVAPKMVRYRDAAGEWSARARGVPSATAADVDALARGETITRARGLETLRTAIARGRVVAARRLTRRLRTPRELVGTRLRQTDGSTLPLRRDEHGMWGWGAFMPRETGREELLRFCLGTDWGVF